MRHSHVAFLLAAAVGCCASAAHAATFSVIYTFPGGSGPSNPVGPLSADSAGNLYGVTTVGGAYNNGTLYQVTPAGTVNVLASFNTGGLAGPQPGVFVAANGTIYGTIGGAKKTEYPQGAIYSLASGGALNIVYVGKAKTAADFSYGLIPDSRGNLYGTSFKGGSGGTVFKFDTANNKLKVLYPFGSNSMGEALPSGHLARDRAGDLFGSAYRLENGEAAGAIYEVTASGNFSNLYDFQDGRDGRTPNGGLLLVGNKLYGTSTFSNPGYGSVFSLTAAGKFKVLHNLTGTGTEGALPNGDLVADGAGNLYGTANDAGAFNFGTIFETAPDGTTSTLYSFTGGADGRNPTSGLILVNGSFYGVSEQGSASSGVLYELTP